MSDFQSAFQDFVKAEPLRKPTGDFYAPMGGTGGDPISDALDAASTALLDDVPGAEKELDELLRSAPDKPNWVFARLSAFSEVIGGVVRKFRKLPDKLAGIIEKFRAVAAAVAKAFQSATFSITVNIPWSIAIGFSWDL